MTTDQRIEKVITEFLEQYNEMIAEYQDLVIEAGLTKEQGLKALYYAAKLKIASNKKEK